MGHTVIGGKHTCRREPAASPRRAPAAPRRFATQGPGAQLPVTCENATAANVGTRGARAPGRGGERRAAATRPPLAPVTPAGPALVRLRGCTLATSDADARDKAENKKERPRTPQTGLRRGKEPSHSPSRWRRPRGDGSGPSRAPVTGCGPGASRGVGGGRVSPGAARGLRARVPGRGRTGRGRRPGRPGNGGTRAAHSPSAAAPAAAQALRPRLPDRPPLSRRGSRALARSAPCAPPRAQRRRVSGLRSGESPPPDRAGGVGRRRRRERGEARPGPRPDAGPTVRAPRPAAAPPPQPGRRPHPPGGPAGCGSEAAVGRARRFLRRCTGGKRRRGAKKGTWRREDPSPPPRPHPGGIFRNVGPTISSATHLATLTSPSVVPAQTAQSKRGQRITGI